MYVEVVFSIQRDGTDAKVLLAAPRRFSVLRVRQ